LLPLLRVKRGRLHHLTGGTIGLSPIPFQMSFDPPGYPNTTSTYTSMYADLPEPSKYLYSKEEDGLGPGLDLSGLLDPRAMRHFLSACNSLLFDGSNGYSSNDEGYD
jgi:hypothetical protein